MSKHAPEPLCRFCGEDRHTEVQRRRDGTLEVWECNVCGQIWSKACAHGYLTGCPHCRSAKPRPDVRDVSGVEMTDP